MTVSKPLQIFSATIIMMLIFALAGCSTTKGLQVLETEHFLMAAGFQMQLADTPEKLEHLKTLTQKNMIRYQRDEKIYYVYADATACKCLYEGTEEDYLRYKDLLQRKKQLDKEQKMLDSQYRLIRE
jgi:vacuolar-type H+-ATPase subunit I/STV1